MVDFTKKYENLPGMLIEYKDGGMALKKNTSTVKTDSILILGTAFDGPVMEPVAVDDDSAYALFGESTDALGASNGATLLKAYAQARNIGCTDIRLMRVTGKTAKTQIKSAAKEVTELVRIEEDFATVSGNDETVITLSNDNINVESLKVYVKGVLLKGGYALKSKDLTIEAGVADANAAVTVQYAHTRKVLVNDEMHEVSSNKTITLNAVPKEGTILISNNEQEIASSKYTVEGKLITFTDETVNASDILAVDYELLEGEVVLVTENGTPEVPFLTATSKIKKLLKEQPKEGSIKLYVNGVLFDNDKVIEIGDGESEEDAEILHGGNFDDESTETIHGGTFDGKNRAILVRVNPTRKTVLVDKKYFKRGDEITVEYLNEKVSNVEPVIEFESYFGGEVYNQGYVTVKNITSSSSDNVIGKKVVITVPDTKSVGATATLEYSSLDYKTFGALVQAINQDANNGVYKATTLYDDEYTMNLTLSSSYFVDGEDGLNPTPQEMFEALTGSKDSQGLLLESGAFQLLEGYQVDSIVVTGVYADQILVGKFNNFAYELALLCAVLSHRNKATIGFISVSPCKDTSLRGVQEYTEKLVAMNNLYFLRDQSGNIIKDSNGDPMDLGKFISVVAGPEIEHTDSKIGRFWGNPAVDYAAKNSLLAPQSAPTNKKIDGVKKLKFNFSNYQLDRITGNRIITFRSKLSGNTNNVVIVDGVTSAHPNSDYTRITTQRVMRYVSDEIREAGEPFLGEPNTIEQRNALASAISKKLSTCKEGGVIIDYAFQILSDAKSQLLGEANIELSIIPPQELRKITAVMGLKASL